jgi:hypothetical protein
VPFWAQSGVVVIVTVVIAFFDFARNELAVGNMWGDHVGNRLQDSLVFAWLFSGKGPESSSLANVPGAWDPHPVCLNSIAAYQTDLLQPFNVGLWRETMIIGGLRVRE